MTTPWTRPSTIRQYAEAETHIAWRSEHFIDLHTTGAGGLETVAPLLHISRSPKTDIIYKTWYLELTGFNFVNLPAVVTGISARIDMDRAGRIADDTIQLTYQDELIGSNRPAGISDPRNGASLLTPLTIYGGSDDVWNIKNLTLDMISDPTFGITVRYQSHPFWPHKSSPTLRSIQLQII